MSNSLKIGVNRIVINPPLGSYLIGYADRKGGAAEIHDDLTATSLVLSSDLQTFFVLISVDNLSLNWEIVDRIKLKIKKELDIPKQNIRIFSSHTHSGPVGWAPSKIRISDIISEFFSRIKLIAVEPLKTKWAKSNRHYFENLIEDICDSVEYALNSMDEVKAFYSNTQADFSFNRRAGKNKNASFDKSIQFLKFVSNGKTIASIINYACHNVALGPRSNVISADITGEVRANIESEFGGNCIFIQGAAGDINPDAEWGENNFNDIKHLGKIISDAVIKAKSEVIQVSGLPLLSFTDEVKAYLEFDTYVKNKKFKPKKVVKKEINKQLKIPELLVFPMLNFRFPWKTQFGKDDKGYYTPIRVGVLRIGDVLIVSVSMEVFNGIGCKVKKLSKLPVSIFAGYTDGLTGYLPEEKEFESGGYEIDTVPYFYRLPGTLKKNTEEAVIKKIKELLVKANNT